MTFSIEALVAFIIIFLCASVLCCLTYRSAAKLLWHFEGEPRSRLIFSYSMIAPVIAIGSSTVVNAPDSMNFLGFAHWFSHCHESGCVPHRPEVSHSSFGWVAISGIGFIVVACLVLFYASTIQHYRQKIRLLDRLSRNTPGKNYKLVESNSLLAYCGGLLRPAVFISRGLREKLTEQELKVVLAHETAHAVRMDNLFRLMLQIATFAWPSYAKQQIRDDYKVACESACDELAGCALANKELVAATILKVQRIRNEGATIESHPHLNTRIKALATSADAINAKRIWLCWLSLALVGIAIFTPSYHFMIEHLLHLFDGAMD